MPRLPRVRLHHVALPVLGLMACVAGGDAAAPPPATTGAPVIATATAALPPVQRTTLTAEERAKAGEIDPSTLRDPFQRPADAGPTPGEPAIEAALRERNASVPFGETAVGDLVVRGTARDTREGYAIIADTAGKSEVVHVGSRIGRARVQGREIIDWRVERVKDGEVVLVEESFAQAGAAPTTLVLRSGRG